MSALEAMGAEYLAHRQNPPTLTERQTAIRRGLLPEGTRA